MNALVVDTYILSALKQSVLVHAPRLCKIQLFRSNLLPPKAIREMQAQLRQRVSDNLRPTLPETEIKFDES